MQSSSINTTNERLFDRLASRLKISKEQIYFSGVDQEFKELFAEILGRICKCSIYLSEDINEKDLDVLRLQKGRVFEIEKLLQQGIRK
jgi:hypothetical protein